MSKVKEIKINRNNTLFDGLFDRKKMFYKEFPGDYRQIRYFTLLIVQKAPPEIKEINLLEQQISELIKNAIKHGNRNNPLKKVKVWFLFTKVNAHLIIEDEGKGFKEIKKWNEFNRKRSELFATQNFEEMAEYISYRTDRSDDSDGGNALFAAVEYWDGGIVFNDKGNCVAVSKIFPRIRRLLPIELRTMS